MNYTELSDAIKNYTENEESSFVASIPLFVELAEKRVYNTVQTLAARKNATGNMTANSRYLTLPLDWLASHSMAVIDPVTNEASYLLNKDVEFIRAAFPDGTDTGKPAYYALFDKNTALLGPTPDLSYQTEIHYFGYPTSIVTAGTTWLGDNFPDVLLYGSVREAYLYMKGEQDITTYYEQKYQEGLMLLKTLSEGKNRQDNYRTGQNRMPVQ